jgi:hypothetical protein
LTAIESLITIAPVMGISRQAGELSGHFAKMKTSMAFKHSINWFPILLVVVPCLWGLCVWLWDWPLAVITALISVYLVQDAWNLVKRKRAAQMESRLLSEKVPRR